MDPRSDTTKRFPAHDFLKGSFTSQTSWTNNKRIMCRSRCPETFNIRYLHMYCYVFQCISGGFKAVAIIVNRYCHHISYLSSDWPTSSTIEQSDDSFQDIAVLFSGFYPTALKGCRGIVFTHGVQMGGRVRGRAGSGK